MESVLGRYRNLVILVGVLFLQVLGLAVQVKRGPNDAQDTRLIRIWAVGAISPFERGLVWIKNSGTGIWHDYFYLRGVRAENRQLKEQIEQMRLEEVRLSEDAAQAHRLQNLLAFKEQFIAKTVAAQVIGSSGSDLSRVIYIDKGEDAGLRRDMAVITADGVVGKILVVYPSVSQVLLINDQSSGVGVILEKSRLQGVLRGAANGEVVLERIMSNEQVQQGETVLTSGGDQIFPKGLPAGTVSKVALGKDLFLNIKVRPSSDLSKLEEVLVLVEKQERQPAAEAATHVRAADILAQRLPSVPDKPAGANGSGKTEDPSAAKPQTVGSTLTNPHPSNTAMGGAASPVPKVPTTAPNAVVQAKTPVQTQSAQTQPAQPKLAPKTAQRKPDQAASEQSTADQPRIDHPKASQPAVQQPKAAQPGGEQTKPAAKPSTPPQTNPQPSAEPSDPH